MKVGKKRFCYLFFLLCFLSSGWAAAQTELMFNHITTEDGLSSNNVRAFLQDYQNFIWIGSENGLHRYDGYELRVYQKVKGDSSSIGGNFIMAIFEDSNHRLWIGTQNNGIALYNREKDSFYNYTHHPDDSSSLFASSVSSFVETEEGVLWISTEKGGLSSIDLNSFDPNKPVFSRLSLPQYMLDEGSVWIRKMIKANDENQFWLAVYGSGLVLFDAETNEFTEIFREGNGSPELGDKRLIWVYEDSKDRLWLSSRGSGLYMYNREANKLINYAPSDRPNSLPNIQITEVVEDKSGNFWIGTDDGLCKMIDFNSDFPEDRFEVYVHDPFVSGSLKTNVIKPLYLDNQDRLWIGTYFGGISVYHEDYFRFTTIRHHPMKDNSIPGNNISAVLEDKNGDLWIGTDGEGLCFLQGGSKNIAKDIYQSIRLINPLTGVNANKIKCLEFDPDGSLWIGTWGDGLFHYYPLAKKYKHYPVYRQTSMQSESVYSLAADNRYVWFGLYSSGLGCYDKVNDTFKYYRHSPEDETSISDDKVKSVLMDQQGKLWIGTEGGGLNVFIKETQTFDRVLQEELGKEAIVISLYQCHDGNIWIGTHSQGLIKLDPKSNEVTRYDKSFGLPDNLIQSIIEDKDYYLWVGTNLGISKFVFKDNSVTNYSKEEGLQSDQFNPRSVETCSDGLVIFGGVNGMNAFYPQDIHKNSYVPDLVFTRFWLDNLPVSASEKGSPLEKNIIVTKSIDLNSDQHSFSIEYSSLEYDFSNRTKYFTKLEGFENDWVERRTERKVTYTNLDPGEYKLLVKSANKDGFLADQFNALTINIHPAWYETQLALVLFFLFTVAIVYLLIQLRINFFKNQSLKLEKIVSIRTQELSEKTNEILAQNEELLAQNDQITEQREELESTRDQLENLNSNLEKLVEERTEKLEKTITELDRFVYSASHDLSAPLKSVLGLLNIAKIDKDKKRTPQYLEYIEESILKLEEVIKSLISYSRNSRLEVKSEKLNIRELVEVVINELAFMASSQKIKFQNGIPDGQEIITDMQRLKIILHNLINNSIKYSDPQKTESIITISFERSAKKVTIIIEDNGIGIEANQLKKIFSMFYRATEKSTGSGLGLFIVKETLSVLGGKIKVDSEPGVGSKFKVSIPA